MQKKYLQNAHNVKKTISLPVNTTRGSSTFLMSFKSTGKPFSVKLYFTKKKTFKTLYYLKKNFLISNFYINPIDNGTKS